MFAVLEGWPRQIEHLWRLHIGKVTELGQQFRQVHKLGKARVHPVAGTCRRQFQRRHRLTKIGSPGVELRHTRHIQCLGVEVALHGVEFRHGIGDWCPRGKHHALFLVPLPQPARLDVHVRCTVACAVRQTSHTGHLGDKAEVFVQIGFVHEDAVNAHFFKADGLVLLLAFGAVFDLLGQTFLRGFQHFDNTAIALIDIGFTDGFFQRLQFLFHIGVEQLVRHGQQFKGLVRDNHRIVVAGGNTRHGFLAVAALKMLLSRDEDIGLGIEVHELLAPLFDQVVRNHHHAFLDQADAFGLHRRRRHDPSLARTDTMGEQSAVTLQNTPHGIFLVRSKVAVAQDRLVHPRKGQVRPVIATQAQGIEFLVIENSQPSGAVIVRPYPFGELVLELLLRFPRLQRLPFIDHALFTVGRLQRVIGSRHFAVQRILDQIDGGKARGAVGRGIADIAFDPILGCYRPSGQVGQIIHLYRLWTTFNDMGNVVGKVVRGYPSRPQPRGNLGWDKVNGLHTLQRRDIAEELLVQRCR